MDYLKILKRAWHILKQYRVLWVFGIILALTTASPGAQSAYRANGGGDTPSQEFNIHPSDGGDFEEAIKAIEYFFEEVLGPRVELLITLGIVLVLIVFAFFILSRIARYVSEAAVIRMVDTYEESGEQYTVRQGWKLGWSRAAWRIFLINLVIGLPIFVIFLLLLLLVFFPLLLWSGGNLLAGIAGTVSTIGFAFLLIFFGVIVGAVVSLLKHFFRRVCVLEDTGVKEAIRQGFAVVKQNWKDVGVMWLVTIGMNIAWPIVMIPIVFLFLGVGALLGGGVALLVRGVMGLLVGNITAWVVAGVFGVPIFMLILIAPLTFLGGLRTIYISNVWTLTYRELRAIEALEIAAPSSPESQEIAPA